MSAPPSIRVSSVSQARKIRNVLMLGLISLALLVALIGLGAVIVNVIQRGFGLVSWSFLTKAIPTPRTKGPGMGPAVAGTIIITAWAAAIAIPLGVLGAIYCVEYGAKGRLSGLIRFLADVMAGVPSIVMGLFVYVVFTVQFKLQGFGGSLALACLMLPIVIRSTDTMLRLVPRDQREASRALGASHSRTVLRVVLPAALPGITSGCLLAVARAAGETAPLLFTIGFIFAHPNWNVFGGPNTTLSAQIFSLAASSPYQSGVDRAWAAALTLIVLVVALTVLARLITSRLSRVRP